MLVVETVGRWVWLRAAGESTPGGGTADTWDIEEEADEGLDVFCPREGVVAPRTFACTASIACIFAVAAAA